MSGREPRPGSQGVSLIIRGVSLIIRAYEEAGRDDVTVDCNNKLL